MPATSQKQEKLMNWVHAVQKGEAKGSGKVNRIAKQMKPKSVEHFMGRGHIDKDLPVKKACDLCNCGNPDTYHTHKTFEKNMNKKDMKKEAFEKGFVKAAIEYGLTEKEAKDLYKEANVGQSLRENLQGLQGVGPGQDSILAQILGNAGAGGAIGAGLGGATGYMAGRDNKNPQNDHRIRDAILGMLAGGGLGATAGGAGTASYMANKYPNSM
jgi:hypothetical protein